MIKVGNERVRRRDRRIWYFVGGIFVAVFLFTFLIQKNKTIEKNVGAANLAAFDPGYIISDYQMSNYNSMNEAQIQAFLKSKNSCNDTYINRYTAGEKVSYFSEMSPPRTWHIKDGHFVCMADEAFDGGTAAHIIYRAAQDYRINPQVLLVLLEKEQSLVRDTFPHSQQYRSATGYGCPDTAACSSKYYGLQNQIRNAAALFRTVLDGGWTNYPLGNNYIQYNPNAACGGSIVNIRNRATSALYRYTPYQPNVATLGGRNDGCSAYGNMNFYILFEDWFGGIRNEVLEEPVIEAETRFERPVEDGVYQIVSNIFPDKVIDIKGGIQEGMIQGSLQTFARKNDNMDNQLFEIKYDETNGYYDIVNIKTGLSVDVKGARTANSTGTQVYLPHDRCNQDWLFEKDNAGFYKIISRCSSKVLDASLSSGFVNIFVDHDGKNQKWKLVRIKQEDEASSETINGVFQIVSKKYPEKAIDIIGGVRKDMGKALLQVYPKKETNYSNQIFSIKYNYTSGYYNIINPLSGLAIDVVGAKNDDSTHTQIYPAHDRCNQNWEIEKDAEDYYTIISSCSSKVLDASLSTGYVNIFRRHDGDNQKWKLISVDY